MHLILRLSQSLVQMTLIRLHVQLILRQFASLAEREVFKSLILHLLQLLEPVLDLETFKLEYTLPSRIELAG